MSKNVITLADKTKFDSITAYLFIWAFMKRHILCIVFVEREKRGNLTSVVTIYEMYEASW